jgi:hypothetical protein
MSHGVVALVALISVLYGHVRLLESFYLVFLACTTVFEVQFWLVSRMNLTRPVSCIATQVRDCRELFLHTLTLPPILTSLKTGKLPYLQFNPSPSLCEDT